MNDLPESLNRELDRTRSINQYDVPWSRIKQHPKRFYDRLWFYGVSGFAIALMILWAMYEAGCFNGTAF